MSRIDNGREFDWSKTTDDYSTYRTEYPRGAGYKGDIRPMFNSVAGDFDLKTFHVMNEPIEFTRESWRGRIRACRAIGATLNPTDLVRFDQDHEKLLEQIAPEQFAIFHQIAIHILVRKGVLIDV